MKNSVPLKVTYKNINFMSIFTRKLILLFTLYQRTDFSNIVVYEIVTCDVYSPYFGIILDLPRELSLPKDFCFRTSTISI